MGAGSRIKMCGNRCGINEREKDLEAWNVNYSDICTNMFYSKKLRN